MVLVMGRGEDDLMEKTFDFYSDSSDFYTVKCVPLHWPARAGYHV